MPESLKLYYRVFLMTLVILFLLFLLVSCFTDTFDQLWAWFLPRLLSDCISCLTLNVVLGYLQKKFCSQHLEI